MKYEEYELVMNWSEDLKLNTYFEFVDEIKYRSKLTDVDTLLESIEKDPFDTDPDKMKDREMDKFQTQQQAIGTNMAVVMYMVDALNYFKGMAQEKIQGIAFEIAMQGRQGYNPESTYKLTSIPGKDFSGYQILAYYYVSWALAIPDMLSQLQLAFDEEYKMARGMVHPPNF